MNPIRALAALAAAALAGCGNGAPPPDPVRPVLTLSVGAGGALAPDVYSGEVRARHESDLAFRIGGKLVERLVDAGSRVRKGQPLARLDPEDARLAAAAARAGIAAAESELALARAERDRYADLAARQFVSRSALDARESTLRAAEARLERARAEAGIAVNQAEYATLVADAEGIVLSVAAEPGQVVSAGQPVMRLGRDGEREVVISVPESRIAGIVPGTPALLRLWADPAVAFPGRVREVAGGADPVTRTFAVRVSAIDAPPASRIGMTATVQLAPRDGAGLVVLPLAALTREGGQAVAWVVDPKTRRVARRAVSVGAWREDGAVVTSGLASGEIVVAAGVHKLREGQEVRLAGAAAPATR